MDWADITTDAIRTALGFQTAYYALAAVGLNLQFGYSGLMNFGYVASLTAGAYGAAIPLDHGAPFWVGILCGLVAALVFSAFLGLFASRLRLDYLAIVTIAVGEILRYIIRSSWAQPLTGGVFSLTEFASTFHDLNPIPEGQYGWGNVAYSHRTLWPMALCWLLVGLFTLLIWLLIKSPWGRMVRAIREDEFVARSLGKNVFLVRMQSFSIGGLAGAMAGMMQAFDQNSINPSFYLTLVTFVIFITVLLGGTGTIFGPILGAVVYWFLFEWFEGFMALTISRDWYSGALDESDASTIRNMMVGAALMAVIIFRRQGILGNRRESELDAF